MKRLSFLPLVLLALAAACGGNQASPSSPPGARDIITLDEIQQSGATDAFGVVQLLRPQWLRVRGSADGRPVSGRNQEGETVTGRAAGSVMVYLDNARLGTAESLRGVGISGLRYIRWFSPAQANLRWGVGNASGAIQLSTQDLPAR